MDPRERLVNSRAKGVLGRESKCDAENECREESQPG
jgi:hypothetical protein